MRIIARKTLKTFWEENPTAEQPLLSWFKEAEEAEWENHNELKEQYHNASVISSKRVIFNIKGNKFRLIVDIEYKIKVIFVVWVGTHADYDNINAKEIKYVKSN